MVLVQAWAHNQVQQVVQVSVCKVSSVESVRVEVVVQLVQKGQKSDCTRNDTWSVGCGFLVESLVRATYLA